MSVECLPWVCVVQSICSMAQKSNGSCVCRGELCWAYVRTTFGCAQQASSDFNGKLMILGHWTTMRMACAHNTRKFKSNTTATTYDGVLENDAKVELQNLAGSLAKKPGKTYSETSNFMKSRMSIAIVQATHLCIRGSHIPTSRMSQRPQWENGAGPSLF